MLFLWFILFQPEIHFGPARDEVVAGPFDEQVAHLQLQLFVSEDCERLDGILPILGRSFWRDDELVFAPTFPLVKGVNYCACVNGNDGHSITKQAFRYATSASLPNTRVKAIYPSAAVLPANHLRFYIYFSAPMTKGQSYDHIQLLRADGSVVKDAFFEDRAELWDPEQRRFTLHFDPGRVKRGLRYREELGPILEEGQAYTLVIKSSWLDGDGLPLVATVEKHFLAGPPDYAFPKRDSWRVQFPALQSHEPFILRFPQPLDYGLLQHAIVLLDQHDQPISGLVEIEEEERVWRFIPEQPWMQLPKIEVSPVLADACGNRLEAPFERKVD